MHHRKSQHRQNKREATRGYWKTTMSKFVKTTVSIIVYVRLLDIG